MATEAAPPSRSPSIRRWLVLGVLFGAFAGTGVYTFRYAEGFSYFSKSPSACVNCHIMQPEYDSWQKASHHDRAVCVDCHLPHDFVPKYIAKAENGYRHGKMFTLGNFKEPIQVAPRGREILEENCRHCHEDLVAEISELDPKPSSQAIHGEGLACLHCHASAGHGIRSMVGGPLRENELSPIVKSPP